MTGSKKNILVITIGTREVQIEKDRFPNDIFEIDEQSRWIRPKQEPENTIAVYGSQDFPKHLCFSEPRKTGEMFDGNKTWQKYLCFPVIQPLLDYLKEKQVPLHYVLLVDTDQEESIKQRSRDTLFFTRLVEAYICDFFKFQYTPIHFDKITVDNDVTNIDKLYPLMEEKGRNLFAVGYDDIDKVYLFPQGGIDQINQSLMLKLIQHYRNKVVQFQNAEEGEVLALNFPSWFIKDLNREKLRKHIEDFNYSVIDNFLTDDPEVLNIVKYASRKLELDYDDKYVTEYIQHAWLEPSTDESRRKDLYLAAKMNYQRKEYSAYVWKLFTIAENYFKPYIIDYFGASPDLHYDKVYDKNRESENPEWVNLLKRESGLYEKLKKETQLNNPNRMAYIRIVSFLFKLGKLSLRFGEVELNVFAQLDKLSKKRNQLAHYLKPLQENDLMVDEKKNYHTTDLNNDLDKIFSLSSPSDYGIYSQINHYLLTLL